MRVYRISDIKTVNCSKSRTINETRPLILFSDICHVCKRKDVKGSLIMEILSYVNSVDSSAALSVL